MESSNPEHFFETDAQVAKRQARSRKEGNTFGNPIKATSKVLAVLSDPTQPLTVFTAESGGRVARYNLETRTTIGRYQGPSVPVTCLAIGGKDGSIVFAGSWDKSVWSWDMATRKPLRRYDGHSDFVKSIVTGRLGGRDILVSGGADKKILVWDIATGRRLYTLKDPHTTMMSLQSLAIDPVLSTAEELVVVSASSDPYVRRWRLREDGGELIAEEPLKAGEERVTIEEHETSVYKVLFDADGEDVDLWTASADGTTKCLARAKKFTAEDTFEHGDFVKGLAVTEAYVLTGGFSQDVKVWDRTSGALLYTISAHFDEITDFAIVRGPSSRLDVLCSVSIDCTIRTWPLDKPALDAAVEEIRKAAETDGDDKEVEKEKEEAGPGLMTAEEEAELAALMDDD
ncbi:WD domain-containing protein [Plectosphaerella plurivora]|uniref:WD domain-containing protein n=1 Tax=Plectosphaerella plurivora TaxID=936078 RepID=A0A9P8VJN5_9PEZI|nr:WD domain-containing protein [Plectosphaerella plurivora]